MSKNHRFKHRMQEVNRTSVIKRICLVNKSLVEVAGKAVICSTRDIARPAGGAVLPQRVWGGSNEEFQLVPLVFAGILLSSLGFSQQPQPAQPQPAAQTACSAATGATSLKAQEHAANLDVGNTPTPSDMYCSGFLTTEKVPDKLFVAAGHNSPDQTPLCRRKSDMIFIHGQGHEGRRPLPDRPACERHEPLRNLSGQKRPRCTTPASLILRLAIVKVTDVQKDTADRDALS